MWMLFGIASVVLIAFGFFAWLEVRRQTTEK
jgi:hypothetical protein